MRDAGIQRLGTQCIAVGVEFRGIEMAMGIYPDRHGRIMPPARQGRVLWEKYRKPRANPDLIATRLRLTKSIHEPLSQP
jgi:hypothetical protein